MTEPRCDTTDLIVGQCAHCKPKSRHQYGIATDVAAPVVTRSITARYDTPCLGCGRAIYEGDAIHLVDGEWICNLCVGNP